MSAKKKVAVKKPPEHLIKLGKRIRELRRKKGHPNMEHFAYQFNFDRSQMGRWERGENITYSSLYLIMQALQVTPQEFFSEGFDQL